MKANFIVSELLCNWYRPFVAVALILVFVDIPGIKIIINSDYYMIEFSVGI